MPQNNPDSSKYQLYDRLLKEIEPILLSWQKQDRLRPPKFNIFLALGHAYREVSTHSAMLVHLLDPDASHAQSTIFLNNFLEIVKEAAVQQGKQLQISPATDSSRWRCQKEVPLPDGLGQADIILRGPDLLILIENKIFANDQHEQLQRYWKFAKEEALEANILPLIIYLTPYGHPPEQHSSGDSVQLQRSLILLSYHEHIYRMIENSRLEIKAVSVSEVLRQYAMLVRSL